MISDLFSRARGLGNLAVSLLLISTNFTLFSRVLGAATALGSPGVVRYVKSTNSDSNIYTDAPTVEHQQWMVTHFWRTLVFSRYWDTRLTWDSNVWVYKDSYGISPTDGTVQAHPDWVLKDAQGNLLYLQFGCSGGTCSHYAADVSNPEFRQAWLDSLAATLSAGYKGVFVDDVNMDWRISNGSGNFVNPIDPNTKQPMTLTNWRLYMAQFMEQIRNRFPNIEIVHNEIWYTNATNPDASIARQIQAADYHMVEFGFNDSGVKGGSGEFSVTSLMNHVDYVHSLGRGTILSGVSTDTTGKEYATAGYFLVSNGQDSIGSPDVNDFWDTWWQGYEVDLGAPTGGRYKWNGLWRRDFAGGLVLLNEPGAATVTATLSGTYQRSDGTQISSITLTGRQGAVLVPAAGSIPQFSAGSVVNAASFTTGLVPGSLASIFLTGLLDQQTLVAASQIPLPTNLAGVTVSINGHPAPLYAVLDVNGQQQVNLQIPYEASGTAAIVVSRGSLSSAPVNVLLLPVQPGVFTLDGTTAVMVHNSDNTLVTAQKPARPGDVLYFYATGLGPVDHNPGTGNGGPFDPLARTLTLPQVTMGGKVCEVAFAGLAPGFVGVYQVNIVVPDGAPSGNLTLVLSLSGVPSPATKVIVQ